MKKLLLSALCAAAFLPISAKTVTFIGELSWYTPTDPEEEVVRIPVSWTGRTIYSNATNLYFAKGTRISYFGGLYLKNGGTTSAPLSKEDGNAYMSLYPAGGVTIKKITVDKFGSTMWDFEEMEGTGKTQTWSGDLVGGDYCSVSKKFPLKWTEGIDDHSGEWTRINYIKVEYDGTPNRAPMPTEKNADTYITNEPLQFSCADPSAKIYYTLQSDAIYDNFDESKDAGYELYNGAPIQLDQPTLVAAYTKVEGKPKSGLFYRWYIPGPEGTEHAKFIISDPATMGLNLKRSQPYKISYLKFNDNGITFIPTSNVTTNNSHRVMSTEAYGNFFELRCPKSGATYQNRLVLEPQNATDAICAVYFKGSAIKAQLEPSQKYQSATRVDDPAKVDEGGFTTENKVTDKEYKFPDNVDFTNEEAANYKSKILASLTGNYLIGWKQSEDYEGDTEGQRVIFEHIDNTSLSSLSEIHVFYYKGDDSAVRELNADENAPVEYYNLQGIKVSGNQPGLYIRRQGSKTTKVLVK